MQYYPLKLIIPPTKTRLIFFESQEDLALWTKRIKVAQNVTNLFDFYMMDRTLGKGQFGLVKYGRHLRTGQEVAIKQVKKKNMTHVEAI